MKINTQTNKSGSFPVVSKLVLGCIEAKFCNLIFVGNLSPGSTQCTYASLGEKNRIENEIMKMYANKKYSTQCTPLHRSQCSKFSSKIAENFANFFAKFR